MAKKVEPSLKSTSGAGFSFEDQVGAALMAEMLAGRHSLGLEYGTAMRIERQASDWEPFGDILVTAANTQGQACEIGGSVKSNRQITAGGVSIEFREGLWTALNNKVVPAARGALVLYSAPLSPAVFDQVNSLCRQARELEPQPPRRQNRPSKHTANLRLVLSGRRRRCDRPPRRSTQALPRPAIRL